MIINKEKQHYSLAQFIKDKRKKSSNTLIRIGDKLVLCKAKNKSGLSI